MPLIAAQRLKNFARVAISVGLAVWLVVTLSMQVTAISNLRVAIDEILKYGIIEPTPQISVTEWVDRRGLIHRITTARRLGESDIELDQRHAEAVEAFIKTFKPREQ